MSKSIKLPQRHKEVLAVIFYTFECLLNQNLTNQYFLILSNHTDGKIQIQISKSNWGLWKIIRVVNLHWLGLGLASIQKCKKNLKKKF